MYGFEFIHRLAFSLLLLLMAWLLVLVDWIVGMSDDIKRSRWW